MNKICKVLFVLFPFSTFSYCQTIEKDSFLLPDTVFFRINKTVIDSAELKKIEIVANYMERLPNTSVEVIGYSGRIKRRGTATMSIRLSLARAGNVAKALRSKYNIDKERIIVVDGNRINVSNSGNDSNKRCVIFKIKP